MPLERVPFILGGPPELGEQPSRVVEMIVEDLAGNVEEVADEGVAHRLSHGQNLALKIWSSLVGIGSQALVR